MFIKTVSSTEKYVLRVSKIDFTQSAKYIVEHISNEYSSTFTSSMPTYIADSNYSRKEFEKQFDDFHKYKKQLHSKNKAGLQFEASPKKHMMQYEDSEKLQEATAHLRQPRNERERQLAIKERDVFWNPKMWQFKL
jgi:hydroxymethylpyrimidine pyrophosphatase-like HAD family hydrolase